MDQWYKSTIMHIFVIRMYQKSGNYPVPVGSGIRYKTISGIKFSRYPVSSRILYPVLSGTLPDAAKYCCHRYLSYSMFLVSQMHLNPFATSDAYMRQLFHCLQ